MRKAFLAIILIAAGASVSGCWHHGRGYDHPGYPSDHHDHGGDGYHGG